MKDQRSSSPQHENTMPTPEERDKLWHRVEGLRFAVLSNVDGDGSIRARPLTTQEVDDTGSLLFFVAAEGALADNLARDERVNVTYTDSSDNFYVSFAGNASLRRDPDKATKLWGTMNEAWFPGGPTDPKLMLLEVKVERVEYWDSGSSKLVQYLTMAKAAITKTPPTDMGEHGSFRP